MLTERTENKGTKNPWILLIEKASANGDRRELDIAAFSTDDGIKDFLEREAKKVGQNMQKLERKIIAARRKPSGGLRGLSEVNTDKKGIQRDIDKMKSDIDVLKGVEKQPIKIKMIGKQVVGWEYPARGEGEWARYVGDVHPEILSFSTEERTLLQRIFISKYELMQGKRGALEDYEMLLYELRGSGSQEKLATYRDEISQRFSRR